MLGDQSVAVVVARSGGMGFECGRQELKGLPRR